MSKISEYYDNFLPHLKADHEKENPRHVHIKKRIDQLVRSEMKVLDFGCGTGLTTRYIAEKCAGVTGIDISPKLIEFAKENSAHSRAQFFNVDVGFQDESDAFLFLDSDIIFMNDVLEHIPRENIVSVISELNKMLAKDGMIYVNIPYGPYQSFVGNNYPHLQQIVDETYYIEDLCELFSKIKFVPSFINIYGIDTESQYLEAVFSRTGNMMKYYKGVFDGQKNK